MLSAPLSEIGAILRGPLKEAPTLLSALVLEYAGMLPGQDPGNGQTALICRLQARTLMPVDDAEAEALALRNDAARTMLGYATQGDLDQLAVGYNVKHLVIQDADATTSPPTQAVLEGDDSLRIVTAPNWLSISFPSPARAMHTWPLPSARTGASPTFR